MSEENLFELAARRKFRYSSSKGDLNTEQLFDLPLTSRAGFDLDSVAKAVNAELKSVAEESFVAVRTNTGQRDLEAKLEIVKFVIAAKQKAQEDIRLAGEKAERKRRILEALAAKEDQELTSASKEELLRELESL
jgi:hypothetical protein